MQGILCAVNIIGENIQKSNGFSGGILHKCDCDFLGQLQKVVFLVDGGLICMVF